MNPACGNGLLVRRNPLSCALCLHTSTVVLNLLLTTLFGPSQQRRDDIRYIRNAFHTPVRRQDRDVGPTRHDIVDVQRTLVTHSVRRFGPQVTPTAWDLHTQTRVSLNGCQKFVGQDAVPPEQVLHGPQGKAQFGTAPRDLRPLTVQSASADERNVVGDARTVRGLDPLERLVEDVLRHDAIGRVLATDDGREAWNGRLDGVLATQLAGGAGAAAHERPKPDEDTVDVINRQRFAQDAVQIAQQVLDVVRGGSRMVKVAVPRSVGGADEREVGLIGDCEDNALIWILENICAIVIKQSGNDNVAACKLTADGEIYLSEKDMESILKAKAAIFAGIKSLTSLEECKVEDLETIFLAGGFAGFIDIENAIEIGMLPDISPDKYRKIGNSSLAGAALHILNKDTGNQYVKLITGVKDIILNTVPEFEMNYIDALMLP